MIRLKTDVFGLRDDASRLKAIRKDDSTTMDQEQRRCDKTKKRPVKTKKKRAKTKGRRVQTKE